MSKRQCAIGFFIVAALSTAALAEEPDVFGRIDKNDDGFIAADEVQDAHRRLFDRLLRTSDASGDGKLSRDEFIAGTTAAPDMAENQSRGQGFGRGDRRGPNLQPGQILRRRDRDGDGRLSREETPEPMRPGFDRLDANTDGYLDRDELARLARAFRDARPQNSPDEAQPAQTAERIFRERDANADGRITADELPEERREEFKRMLAQFDDDQDGGLTRAQFSQAFRALQE